MDSGRRNFIKLAGASAAALGVAGAAVKSVKAGAVGPDPNVMKGSRWAMVIDLRKRPDGNWDDAIQACHSIHNVPDIKSVKEEVKWIWTEQFEHCFTDLEHENLPERLHGLPVATLCNHCDNPPCVRVCPTQATFRRPDGIVLMDFHRCIGCRFCMAACPYGSRSFNFRDPRPKIAKQNPEFPTREKGVVEKCNFCAERLAVGKAPACAEACKDGAILFGDLGDAGSDVSKALKENYTIRRKVSLGTRPHVYYIV